MSVNKYKPHVLVLPEDDANRQIAIGFRLDPAVNNPRNIQILPPSGGWKKVVEDFLKNHVTDMKNHPERNIVLLIDFDRKAKTRLKSVQDKIPPELIDRVFIVGALSEPEELKSNLGKNFEDIGKSLSRDCSENRRDVWEHELLKHNETELDRMFSSLRPILFDQPSIF